MQVKPMLLLLPLTTFIRPVSHRYVSASVILDGLVRIHALRIRL